VTRHPASTEEALELFLANRQRGDPTSPEEFAARHADLGPELGSALQALLALEYATRGAQDESIPERIGAYRIVREIGRGGMGVVLEAIEEPLGRRVALKMIPSELLASASARERFRREAALAARLDHPGIATIYGAGVEDGRPWIAMRYVEGRTLAQTIAAARASGASCAELPGSRGDARARALALTGCIAGVARVLQSAHEQGVVHRDLKPSNIIVAADGSPVLLDFGLAITEESEGQTLTRTGETAGTPAYLAPELVGGERARPDAQCDVYALGVTLYECLALRRPFEAPTPAALYLAIVSGVTPGLRAVPRDLAVVVATAMERDRSRRYRSAAAFAEDLEACVAGRPVAARPVPLSGRVARWARREPRQAVLAGLLALATLAAAVLGGTWLSARDEVRAADALARRNALEEALDDGYTALSLERNRDAGTAFARARALEAHNVEALAGLVIAGAPSRPASELHALLAQMPPETRALELLRALVDHEPLPASAGLADLEGLSALDLWLRGMCLETDCKRLPFSARAARHAQAVRCFTEAIMRSPAARPLYHQQRAIAAQGALDAPAARSAAAALLALWPDSPRALYAAGQALSLVDPPAAVRYLEHSLALDPLRRDTYNMLAVACCNAGDPQAAEDWCWRALRLDPDVAYIVFWLAESLGRENCTEEAREAYLRCVALDPSLHEAWSKLALVEFVRGDAQNATRLYAHSLELDPSLERVRIFYGAALEACGRTDESRAEVQQALAGLFPMDTNFWKTTANVFEFLHAPQSALLLVEAGLELAPHDADLAALRASAEAALGQAR